MATVPVPAPHVVLLTSPGAGHVLPVAELATRLAAHHGFTATIVTYTSLSSPAHNSPLSSLPPRVSVAALPGVPLDDIPADAHVLTRIFTVVNRTLPHLRDLLRSFLDSPAGVAAFLTDMLCPAALAVAKELGVPRYVFFTSSLVSLNSLLYTPELARTTACECRDLPGPVVLPGCVPLHGADLVEPVQDRSDPVYPLMVDLGLNYLLADGFIVNTFDAMEHETLAAFKDLSDKGVYPPVYAVGPFIRSPVSDKAGKHSCLRWLDDQPDGSVLYVSFGSGGTLSTEQTAELAAGLEASEQKFLWVVHFPSDKDRSAGYFGASADHGNGPLSYLPEGFVERMSSGGRGLTVPLWAPQVEILNHPAVGGFLSHCGWNSTLESAAAGVPMVAWPLFAEQRVNAVMLSSERVGLALWARPPSIGNDGAVVVPREQVAELARELMAGQKGALARKNAGQLREGAEIALAPGGPQRRALAAVVSKWKGAAGE